MDVPIRPHAINCREERLDEIGKHAEFVPPLLLVGERDDQVL